MRTISLRHVCTEDVAVMDYTATGMVIGKMQHYQVVAMRKNVAFPDVFAMLDYAFERALSHPGSWQIVAEAFVSDKPVNVKGFVVVERDVAVYRTFDTGYEWPLFKECQERSERMELVLQRQLNEGKADMRNTVSVKFDDPAKAVITLAIAVFGVYPEKAKVA